MASPSTGFPTSLTLCLSLEMILRHINIEPVYFVLFHSFIDKINNKLHGLSPPGGLVSPPGGFASLAFDQAVPKNSQRHLADRNAIWIDQIVPGFVDYYLNSLKKGGQCIFSVRIFLCCVSAIVQKKRHSISIFT